VVQSAQSCWAEANANANAFDDKVRESRAGQWQPPPGSWRPAPILAALVEAASRTGLVQFFPFTSLTELHFATAPQGGGQVAPAYIDLVSWPDRYLVYSEVLGIAELVLETDDPAAAAARAEELLASWQLTSKDQQTLTRRASLARRTGLAGDAAAARDQYTALLPACQRVLGPDHPDTLTHRASLAYWTGLAGDAAAARDQYTLLLPICERVLGPEHPETLITRASLAHWTGEAGDAASARDQYAALLPICERVLGPVDLDTRTTRRRLGYWTQQAEPGGN
jgi:tetratricopeptide repeat protein